MKITALGYGERGRKIAKPNVTGPISPADFPEFHVPVVMPFIRIAPAGGMRRNTARPQKGMGSGFAKVVTAIIFWEGQAV